MASTIASRRRLGPRAAGAPAGSGVTAASGPQPPAQGQRNATRRSGILDTHVDSPGPHHRRLGFRRGRGHSGRPEDVLRFPGLRNVRHHGRDRAELTRRAGGREPAAGVRRAAARVRALRFRRRCRQVRHALDRRHHRGGGGRPRRAADPEAGGRSRDGGQVGRRAPAARRVSGADRAHPATGAGGHPELARGRGPGRHAGGGPRRHGAGGPSHPRPRPPLRPGEGWSPEGRRRRCALGRTQPHRVLRPAHRLLEHARHRLHVLGGDHGRAEPRAPARRRHPRGQGLRHAGHPRRLSGRSGRRPAQAFPGGVVMSELEEGKMSFFEHLSELRTRIMWSLAAAGVGLVIAFYFTERVMRYMVDHVLRIKPVFTSPTEGFWTYMEVAMLLGLFMAMPISLWNVWAFVSPGLHKHERKYAAPFVIIGSVLFLLGGAFALFVVVPFAVQFLINFGQQQGLQPMLSISSSVDFILKFTLAFGLVFELPVVITVLSMIGVVTPQFLSKNRKYAILINFIIAAVLTPTPDVINQTLMAGPLIILYEVGIIAARIFGKRAPTKVTPPATAEMAPPGGGAAS